MEHGINPKIGAGLHGQPDDRFSSRTFFPEKLEAVERSLPCLNSNNCNGRDRKLQSNHRKTAACLGWNVAHLVSKFGLEFIGFLTLTFAEHLTCPKEAQKRFHSLRTGVLKGRYSAFLRVFERQHSGRIHYHLLVVAGSDIRTGVNWSEFEDGVYRSASPALRSEWAFWRKTAPLYGFGRTELLPVRSTGAAIGKYVGKYVAKHIDARLIEDKGVRLVQYSAGWKITSTPFSWCSPGARLWRRNLAAFAAKFGCQDMDDLKRIFGPQWAFKLAPMIQALEIPLEAGGDMSISPCGEERATG